MYSTGKFAQKVGVHPHTVQSWDRAGKLKARRTHSGRRYYTDEDVAQVLGLIRPANGRRTVVYCRVSGLTQKPDMINQRAALEQFCVARGLAVDEWVEETGSGLNFKRKKFLAIIDAIIAREIGTLVIAHEDRLMRFGFDLVEHLSEMAGCTMLVMNTESLSPVQEIIQDLTAIVQGFSFRLDGLRHYSKTLKEALADDHIPSHSS